MTETTPVEPAVTEALKNAVGAAYKDRSVARTELIEAKARRAEAEADYLRAVNSYREARRDLYEAKAEYAAAKGEAA